MAIVAFYPATDVSVNIAAIGPNGDPIPTSAILIAGENSTGDLTPVSVDDNGAVNVSFSDFPTDLAKEDKQDDQITLATAANASLSSIDTKLTAPLAVTGPLTDVQLRATPVPVSGTVAVTGVATAANQATEIASLASIDSKLTSPLTVTGPLTDAQLRASPVPVSGTVSTGGLTDAELRATPVPVSVSGVSTAANQVANGVLLGAVTETAPATDTASSGLNGRLQRIAQRLTSLIALFPASIGQKTSAASLAVVLASDQPAVPTNSGGKSRANAPVRNDYASTPVTTGAYVQLIASTTSATSEIEIFDSSGQTMVLAVGGSGSEVDQLNIFPGGNGRVPLLIPAGSRVSVKAVSATANVGEIDINLYT